MTNVRGKDENIFLYLVQHGYAMREEEYPARGLMAKGVQDVRKAAAYAHEMNLRISRILHSGKTWAMQTAQIFADYLKPEKGGFETGSLAPMDYPTTWVKRISVMQENTMLVGHLPHMVKLAGLLLCGNKEKMFIDFKMGGIVCLMRFDDDRWAMEWMLVPEILDKKEIVRLDKLVNLVICRYIKLNSLAITIKLFRIYLHLMSFKSKDKFFVVIMIAILHTVIQSQTPTMPMIIFRSIIFKLIQFSNQYFYRKSRCYGFSGSSLFYRPSLFRITHQA